MPKTLQNVPVTNALLDAEMRPLTITLPELLQDGSDATFRTLVHNLLAFSTRLETVRQNFGAIIGLSGIQYTILISISHHQGNEGVGVKAIAKHLSLSSAFVTIETGKLIKLGFVQKRKNPVDRRRVQLLVTHKGRKLLSSLAPVQQEVNDVLFNSLNRADFQNLNRIILELVDGAEKAELLSDYCTGIDRVEN